MSKSRPTIEAPVSQRRAHITPTLAGNPQVPANWEWVAELLAPFSGNDAAGEDASCSAEYFNLELSFESPTPNFESCIAWAMKLISEVSKDVKVASLLTLCLYRQRGLAGYYEGLCLLTFMLQKFGAAAFPKSPSAKTAAINKLLSTRFLIFLAKEHPGLTEKALLENILQRLREIEENFTEIFADNPPRLKRIADIFAPTLKALQEEEKKQKEEAAKPKESSIAEPAMVSEPDEKNPAPEMASGPNEKTPAEKTTQENAAAQIAEMETAAQPQSQVLPAREVAEAYKTSILPPVMGEEYENIKKEYEAACQRVPAEFDEVAKAMQAGIQGETRRRGRFLRTLNLANLCLQSRQERMAKIFLEKLQQDISDYRLEEWEPALCVAVWSSLYLTLARMLKNETDQAQGAQLQQRLETLYAKITLYDCERARQLLEP